MNKEELYRQVKDKWNQAEGMPAVILPLVEAIVLLEERVSAQELEIKALKMGVKTLEEDLFSSVWILNK